MSADGCGKTPYPTKREAMRVLRLCARNRHPPVRAYPCPSCNHWHLTARDTVKDHGWRRYGGKVDKMFRRREPYRRERGRIETGPSDDLFFGGPR